jgi:hypothetical protein
MPASSVNGVANISRAGPPGGRSFRRIPPRRRPLNRRRIPILRRPGRRHSILDRRRNRRARAGSGVRVALLLRVRDDAGTAIRPPGVRDRNERHRTVIHRTPRSTGCIGAGHRRHRPYRFGARPESPPPTPSREPEKNSGDDTRIMISIRRVAVRHKVRVRPRHRATTATLAFPRRDENGLPAPARIGQTLRSYTMRRPISVIIGSYAVMVRHSSLTSPARPPVAITAETGPISSIMRSTIRST